jgi:hypothetical protein
MGIASGAARVRVHEPVSNVPSGVEPLFAGYIRQLTKATVVRMGLSGALVAFGFLLALTERQDSALPYVYLAAFGSSLATWVYVLSVYRRVRHLFGEPYHRVDVAPDGLLAKGSRVFVRLPGAMWLRAGRIEDAPLAGATPVELVSRRPTPPRRDPVLAANRAFQVRRFAGFGVTFLVVGAAGFAVVPVVRFDPGGITGPAAVGGVVGGSAVLVLLGLLMVVGFLRIRRPVTEDSWVELWVALDTPFVPRTRGVARLTGWALHPDGRQTRFRLVAEVSLAANVAATGQLWLLGHQRPGKPAKAGLPGYPCGGSFRLT